VSIEIIKPRYDRRSQAVLYTARLKDGTSYVCQVLPADLLLDHRRPLASGDALLRAFQNRFTDIRSITERLVGAAQHAGVEPDRPGIKTSPLTVRLPPP
jgi:hypothetical protein